MREESRGDVELLVAARGGDGRSFEGFYVRRRGLVLAFFHRRVGDPEAVADLTGETFAAALVVVLDRERDLPSEPVAWLLVIARHKLIDSLRKGRVENVARERLAMQPLNLDDEDLARIDEIASSTNLEAQLEVLLTPEQLQAIRARVLDERDYPDIAAQLECSEAVVRKRVSSPENAARSDRGAAMTDYLDELGRQLRLAADKDHQATATRIAGRARISSPRLILALTLAVLALAAAALAATAILQTGAAVKPPRGASSTAGVGIPVPGASRILALREPDPAGGLPWGMRVIRTTRGLLCVQVGRVYHGQLGLLGRDGAFGNDGRFHPLPADALTAAPASLDLGSLGPAGSIQTCGPPATTFSQSDSDIQPSGVMPHTRIVPTGQQRWISYGILGPHAQTVVYRAHGQQLSRAVLRPLGAYLIVLAGHQPGLVGPQGGGSSGAGQINTPRPTPSGAVTEITYRFASKTCADRAAGASTCPVATWPLASGHERQLRQRIAVRLRSHRRRIDAIISFRAPYPVASALSGYMIEIPSPCHGGGGGANLETPIDHDIKTGQLVTTTIQNVFANACGPTVTLRVLYQADNPDPLGPSVVVGQTTITRGG